MFTLFVRRIQNISRGEFCVGGRGGVVLLIGFLGRDRLADVHVDRALGGCSEAMRVSFQTA